MVSSSSSSSCRCLLAFILLNFYWQVIAPEPNMAFFFKNFGKDSNFESQLALYGDAMVANDSMSIQISRAGRIIYKKPINLIELNSGNLVSFSNYFVFSIEEGDGLAFVMLPFGFPLNVFDGGSMGMFGERKMKFFAVEFDAFRDEKRSDANGDHVAVDVGSLVSVKISNVSSSDLELSSGAKLQAWIDYEASSKRLEVRMNKFGDSKPVDPLLSHNTDLSMMWKDKRVTVGLSSSSGNSSRMCNLYSWNFRPRIAPHWMHSEPMDPEDFVAKAEDLKGPDKRSGCSLRILAALIFGTGCGALGAFLVMFVWAVVGDRRRPVVPEEFSVQTKEFGSKKFDVSPGKTIEEYGKE